MTPKRALGMRAPLLEPLLTDLGRLRIRVELPRGVPDTSVRVLEIVRGRFLVEQISIEVESLVEESPDAAGAAGIRRHFQNGHPSVEKISRLRAQLIEMARDR